MSPRTKTLVWGVSWKRIAALALRNFYVYKRSFTRLLDIAFWPVLELLLWGFVSQFVSEAGTRLGSIIAFFIGAVILWEVFVRSAIGTNTAFLEDMWTRNFLNIFAAPVRVREFLGAILLSSFTRVLVSFVFLSVLASWIYGFDIFTLGVPLAAFYVNLVITGWSLGILTIAVILRFGQSAEILAWALAFLFQPFAAVFYPVSVLPKVLQPIAHAIPLSHVFEGMRSVLGQHVVPYGELAWAVGLNIIFLTVAIIVFTLVFRTAKKRGFLVRVWQ